MNNKLPAIRSINTHHSVGDHTKTEEKLMQSGFITRIKIVVSEAFNDQGPKQKRNQGHFDF